MSFKVRTPNRINPALSDLLSPEESQALVDAGYGCTLELIDLLNELMWGRLQEDGWTPANVRLRDWLLERIAPLRENVRQKLRDSMLDWGSVDA